MIEQKFDESRRANEGLNPTRDKHVEYVVGHLPVRSRLGGAWGDLAARADCKVY